MKKLLCSLMVIAVFLSASQVFAESWKCFFKAPYKVIDNIDGVDVYGYILGPNDLKVNKNKVVNILQVGNIHLILYITKDTSLAAQLKDWDEFMGFGYTDIVMRFAQGLSNVTLSDIEYITGSHWYAGGEWHFGNVKAWKAAGSPEAVWFGRYRDIMGVDLH